MNNEVQHSVSLINRENLSLTGVKDVDEYNEQEILLICDCGELTIKGELLHIEELSIESGLLTVSGKITSLTYTEKISSNSIFKRLFGG
ncbi:MAG: sporulation protein YabP [Eubacterium sp.]|nr:sporulation protein YabP [Eubacterium sp.]